MSVSTKSEGKEGKQQQQQNADGYSRRLYERNQCQPSMKFINAYFCHQLTLALKME